MKYISTFALFELKGSREKIRVATVPLDDDLYNKAYSKSKNPLFKKVVDHMMDGKSPYQAFASATGKSIQYDGESDYMKFMKTLTKDEEVFLYHLKYVLSSPKFSKEGYHELPPEKSKPRAFKQAA